LAILSTSNDILQQFFNCPFSLYVFFKLISALHGSYGILWLIKDFTFPDSNWEKKQTIVSWIAGILLLGPGYWGFPYLLISG
jgi:hypothetical protein